MKKPVFVVILVTLLGMNSYSKPIEYKWDVAEFTQKRDLGSGETLGDKAPRVSLTCQVFAQFTLFVTTDPGLKGQSYKVRDRRKGTSPKQECILQPDEKLTEFFSGSLVGVIGSKLLLIDDGMLGDESTLVIVDAPSGKTLLRAFYDYSSPVKVAKVNSRVQMTYFAFLTEPEYSCDIKSDKAGQCFRRILELNRVPGASKIKEPNCPAKAESIALFLQVRVNDIQKPKPEFVGQTVICRERQ